jgi:hypothetical protein
MLVPPSFLYRYQTEGPWVVKMAVGNKPALIGKKLRLHYTRGVRFFEIDIDIGSSSVASRVLTLVYLLPPHPLLSRSTHDSR